MYYSEYFWTPRYLKGTQYYIWWSLSSAPYKLGLPDVQTPDMAQFIKGHRLVLEPGHIHLHYCNIDHAEKAEEDDQVWLYKGDNRWLDISDQHPYSPNKSSEIYHPLYSDRILSKRKDSSPLWIVDSNKRKALTGKLVADCKVV